MSISRSLTCKVDRLKGSVSQNRSQIMFKGWILFQCIFTSLFWVWRCVPFSKLIFPRLNPPYPANETKIQQKMHDYIFSLFKKICQNWIEAAVICTVYHASNLKLHLLLPLLYILHDPAKVYLPDVKPTYVCMIVPTLCLKLMYSISNMIQAHEVTPSHIQANTMTPRPKDSGF